MSFHRGGKKLDCKVWRLKLVPEISDSKNDSTVNDGTNQNLILFRVELCFCLRLHTWKLLQPTVTYLRLRAQLLTQRQTLLVFSQRVCQIASATCWSKTHCSELITHKSWLSASWIQLDHDDWQQQPWHQCRDCGDATRNMVTDCCKEPPLKYFAAGTCQRGTEDWSSGTEEEERWRVDRLGWKHDELSLKRWWRIGLTLTAQTPSLLLTVRGVRWWGKQTHTHEQKNKMHLKQGRMFFLLFFDLNDGCHMLLLSMCTSNF